MLSDECNKIISNSSAGVQKLKFNDTTYWIKICGEDKSNVVRKISSYLARWNKFSFFETKAILDSFARFEHEKAMLHYLNELDIKVPNIELEGPKFFVTPDQGTPLNHVNSERITPEVLTQLFSMFATLHNNNIAHGRPALRDIVLNHENELSLLDFEESILDAKPVHQARDIFMLLMDLCRIDDVTDQQKRDALLVWKKQVSIPVWQSLLKINQFLSKFRLLPHLVLIFKKKNKLSKQIISTIRLIDSL